MELTKQQIMIMEAQAVATEAMLRTAYARGAEDNQERNQKQANDYSLAISRLESTKGALLKQLNQANTELEETKKELKTLMVGRKELEAAIEDQQAKIIEQQKKTIASLKMQIGKLQKKGAK